MIERSPRSARTPHQPLYRIGRPPDPLAWPPRSVIGRERFDDPLREYRVLYAASQRAACFAETLAAFRPSLASLAAERAVRNALGIPRVPQVPAAWWRNRLIGTFSLGRGRWLDLRALDSFQVLREAFAELAQALGLADVDLSAATGVIPIAGDERRFTQAISRWAYKHDYHGIAYTSRLHHRFTGWAIFDSASIAPVGRSLVWPSHRARHANDKLIRVSPAVARATRTPVERQPSPSAMTFTGTSAACPQQLVHFLRRGDEEPRMMTT